MPLVAHILPAAAIGAEQRQAMFELMTRHYENVRRDVFDHDLAEKQWVILLSDDAAGRLHGFSTQRMLSLSVASRPVHVVYSGDTIVDREHWGSTALAIAWGKLAFSYIDACQREELYWFLMCKGYRTYRFLPVYFREFWPRYDAVTPASMQAVIDAAARCKYPDRYQSAAGIVKAAPTSDRLRGGLGETTLQRAQEPHVRHFFRLNPGHAQGDELCCLAPLTAENFSSLAQRLIQSPRFASQRVG